MARCTVQRLMRKTGLRGVTRGRRKVRTTLTGAGTDYPVDLVERDFTASAPDRLWVADLERHEALTNRAVVKGHRLVLVAASTLKLRAA